MGSIVIICLGLLVYSKIFNTPLVAGVLDDYKYNTKINGGVEITGGREAELEAIKDPAKFAKDSIIARDKGAAAVAVAAESKDKNLSNFAIEQKQKAAMKEVEKGEYVAPTEGIAAQAYKNSINTSNASIAAEDAFHLGMEGMSNDDKFRCADYLSSTDLCTKAHQAATDAYAQVIDNGTQTSSGGAACAGGAKGVGIGSGQYAQTGYGYIKDTTTICKSNEECAGSDLRECIKCVDGKYDNASKGVCGQGSATNYITRPDQTGLPQNCWKDGAYYSNSSNLDGQNCSNGQWKAGEKDNVLNDAKAVADKLYDECNKTGKHVYLNTCVTDEELKKFNTAEIVAGLAAGTVTTREVTIDKKPYTVFTLGSGKSIITNEGDIVVIPTDNPIKNIPSNPTTRPAGIISTFIQTGVGGVVGCAVGMAAGPVGCILGIPVGGAAGNVIGNALGSALRGDRTPADDVARTPADDVAPTNQNPTTSTIIQMGSGALIGCGLGAVAGPIGCGIGALVGSQVGNVVGNALGSALRGDRTPADDVARTPADDVVPNSQNNTNATQ